MPQPWVAIIIPTHNGVEATCRCIENLRELDYAAAWPVVVDDGGTDGTSETIRSRFPEAEVLQGDGNLWWSGATNLACGHAFARGADYAWLFNNDVLVARDSLSRLVACCRQVAGAIAGAKVLLQSNHDRAWCCGGRVDWLRRGPYMLQEGCPESAAAKPYEVEWLPGMGTLIPTETFHAVGGFDARRFPQYFGDTDFCLRAKALGYRIFVEPRSHIYNDTASTGLLLPPGRIGWRHVRELLTSRRSHMNLVTRVRFAIRHCPPPLVLWHLGAKYAPFVAVCLKKLTVG